MAIFWTDGRAPWQKCRRRTYQWAYGRRHADASATAECGSGFLRRETARVMKTLVTGATGFLGSHVARQLAGRGEQVRVLVRPASDTRAIDGLEAERFIGDLRDTASLERALAGVTRVFHVAADYRLWAQNPQEIYESNVTGTRNLLEAARRAGVEKFVYTSTVATIAVPRKDGLPDESTQSTVGEMIGHYKRSKFEAEQCAMRAAERGRIGERYILGGRNLTLKEMLDMLAVISGLRSPRWKFPHALAYVAACVDTFVSGALRRDPQIPLEGVRMARHKMFVDATKAARELGFSHGPIEGALERAVRWYEANGYVSVRGAHAVARAHAA